MAEDNRAVAEGAASWSLQGGWVLAFAVAAYNHARMRNLAIQAA